MTSTPPPPTPLGDRPLPAPHATVARTFSLPALLSRTSALTPPVPAVAIMVLGLALGLQPRATFADSVLGPHRLESCATVPDGMAPTPQNPQATPYVQRTAGAAPSAPAAAVPAASDAPPGPASAAPTNATPATATTATATPHVQRQTLPPTGTSAAIHARVAAMPDVQPDHANDAEGHGPTAPPWPEAAGPATATPHVQRRPPGADPTLQARVEEPPHVQRSTHPPAATADAATAALGLVRLSPRCAHAATAALACDAPPPPQAATQRQHPMSSGNRGRLKNGAAPGDFLAAPRCGARTRAGGTCLQPAMPNGRCRFHGGKSTGARTEAGRARLRQIHTTHGCYGQEEQARFRRETAFIAETRALLAALRATPRPPALGRTRQAGESVNAADRCPEGGADFPPAGGPVSHVV
jgi:hypothetical protein